MFLENGEKFERVQFEVAGSLSSTCRPPYLDRFGKMWPGKGVKSPFEKRTKPGGGNFLNSLSGRGFSRLIEGRIFGFLSTEGLFFLSKKSKVKKKKKKKKRERKKRKREETFCSANELRCTILFGPLRFLFVTKQREKDSHSVSRNHLTSGSRSCRYISAAAKFSANGVTRNPLFLLPRVPLIVPRSHCFLSFFFAALEERSAYYKGPQNVQEPKREELRKEYLSPLDREESSGFEAHSRNLTMAIK